MSSEYARVEYISRPRNAVGFAAYPSRRSLFSKRTGQTYSFSDRAPPMFHRVFLPDWAPEELKNTAENEQLELLWNAVEAAERRKDSQLARHIVLALPDEDEVTDDDRISLCSSFSEEMASDGLAVQLDIHAPEIDGGGNEKNWHAHLLVTTRRFLTDPSRPGQYFCDKKARDRDPQVRSSKGKCFVTESEALNRKWCNLQNKFFYEQGYETRVDPKGVICQKHLGAKYWIYRNVSEISEHEERIAANFEAAHKPAKVLEELTYYNATFTKRDVGRFLAKHLEGEAPREVARIQAEILNHRDVRPLHDPWTGEESGRFTTIQVRDQEKAAIAAADALAKLGGGAVSPPSAWAACAMAAAMGRPLRPEDQMAAFNYACGPGHLKLIEGRAGTKSHTLSVIREAHRIDGKRVIGLAQTDAVKRVMMADGFAEASTVHSALFKLKDEMDKWDSNTVVMVDEAAMMGTGIVAELLGQAHQSGAKLIMADDDRHLPSIERGGLFSEMLQCAKRKGGYGSAELTEEVRQDVPWQRRVAGDLAQYRFGDALTAFERYKAITWSADKEASRTALVEAWAKDALDYPRESQFVFTYTNDDADALNLA